ncbi:Uncharacterized protein BP5553_05326 [Venustampulla echinocandica]|uniref:F-box domain-containing protein n=1 Tax=Venustampulla echinocandica TaxID=2656787 RepID=A0A370TQU6_9HELO|nr:Uncharacterized protein BP5553_05326 [Venustampulla echinocandica]RDL37893.1 Uncharacterized protein BP5553_05326 [Venustampulla echinocandica]
MVLLFLPQDIQLEVIEHLHPMDLQALAQTSTQCRALVGVSEFSALSLPFPAFGLPPFGGASPTSSQSSTSADNDTLMSTDTEMTTPDEEEWEFQITPDMINRLSKLPKSKTGATLTTLPTELQLLIFGYLDQIDSACLGLASPRTYGVFRAIHGTKMPLNTRRIGPNNLEAAWEVVGKQTCTHCGLFRCELHVHIKGWMPEGLEYCHLKRNFGLKAPAEANGTCFRGKPSKPKRCGRHPLRTSSTHQDDLGFKL